MLAVVALVAATACSGSPTAPSSVLSAASSSAAQAEAAGTQNLTSGPVAGAVGASRFVAFGDSITEGVLSSFDGTFLFNPGTSQSYPFQLQNRLISGHPGQSFTVFNRGIGGETAASGSQRIQSVLAADRPEVLLLLEGINDLSAGFGVGATVGRLQTMLDVAQLNNVTVFIATMFQTYRTEEEIPGEAPRIRENAFTLVEPLNQGIRQIAAGRPNVVLVDINYAFASAPNPRALVGGDGLHPTEEGYVRMARWFGAAIEQTFAVRGAFQ